MKKNDEIEIDNTLKEFPDELAKLLKTTLNSPSSKIKLTARSTLVEMGKTIIPQLHRLLSTQNWQLRMEAVKVAELIADRKSIPYFINLLNDKEFEIRWIAAEGLIKIGRRSILPVLKSVRDGKSDYLHNKGVHHVLLGLLNKNEKEKVMPLLLSLEETNELGETAPVEASAAIKSLFKRAK